MVMDIDKYTIVSICGHYDISDYVTMPSLILPSWLGFCLLVQTRSSDSLAVVNMANPNDQDPKSLPSRLKAEKNAGLIMATNNSSIVSKRSVERLYYPEPHFFQYFVRKPQRRSPTINRGYWLRMHAIETVVKDFLQRASEKQKVVINLGCG